MQKPVRVGLFGAGMIGREHARHSVAAEGVELVAVADPTLAGAEIAEAYGVPCFADYVELLEEVEIDAAVIALPNAMHADAAVAALERGVVALVEKPLADTLDNAVRIVEASERTGVAVHVGHQRRFAPDIDAAQEFIARGGLGEIVSVGLLNVWRKNDEYFDAAWRTAKGAGPVLINLIHDIDAIRYLVGEIETVVSMGSSRVRGFDIPDTFGALLRFENGAIGTAISTDSAVAPWCYDLTSGYGAYFPAPAPPGDVYFISGTEASLAVPSLTVYRHDGEQHWQVPMTLETLPRVEANPYVAQLEHLAAVARGEAEPLISARDAYRSLAVAVAIDDSAESVTVTRVAE